MNFAKPVASPVIIGTPAPLSRDDLGALAEKGRATTSIQRIRASHHKVARLLAHCLTQREAAALTGYSRERIVQLEGSPAMKELIALYIEKVEEREAEKLDAYLELKTSNMIAAERHIADAIAEADENGELIPIRTALAISSDGADRLGYGKRTTNVNLNADLGAALERAIARSGKGPIIDSVPVQPSRPKALSSLTSPSNSSVDVPARPLILRRA